MKEQVKTKNNIQIIVDDNDQFIMVEKYGNKIRMLTPFEECCDEYITNITVPQNRHFHLEKIYKVIPQFCRIEEIQSEIDIDCCHSFEDNFFGKIKKGITMVNISNTFNQDVYNADDVLMLKCCKNKYQPINIKMFDDNIMKFRQNSLKILPIILYDGFIFSTTNHIKTVLYMSVQKPHQNIIGKCSKMHSFKIKNYFKNIWDIFKIQTTKNKATIKFNLDYKFEEKNPIVLKMTRYFKNSDFVKIEKLYEDI